MEGFLVKLIINTAKHEKFLLSMTFAGRNVFGCSQEEKQPGRWFAQGGGHVIQASVDEQGRQRAQHPPSSWSITSSACGLCFTLCNTVACTCLCGSCLWGSCRPSSTFMSDEDYCLLNGRPCSSGHCFFRSLGECVLVCEWSRQAHMLSEWTLSRSTDANLGKANGYPGQEIFRQHL